MAIARSSTEIMVTWEEVLPIDQNGIITNYDVRYEPLQFVESLSTIVTNTTDLAVNLTNLQEYVEYNISVRAYTSIGFGPFSTEITERTFEDGRCLNGEFTCASVIIIFLLQSLQHLLRMCKRQLIPPLRSW